MVKVSVIVPVYKAENYIHRCIDSILAQTMPDFEVLLIDDGSPDRSGEICEEYAQKDSRVRVIHKENGGVASARQLGMDKAQGEYIIHADPDDWIEANMLKSLYAKAIKTDADIVICDFYYNNDTYVRQQPSALDNETVLKELFQQLHGSCWNKLIKRSCYNKYEIRFKQSLVYCEDLTFWVRLLKYPIKIDYLPQAFYHYVQHDNTSIVHTYMNKSEDEGWKVIRLLWKELKDYPIIRKIACSRCSYNVVNDAFLYGKFNSWSFFKRYSKYVPFLLYYKEKGIRDRLLYVRICLGFYSHYKKNLR